MNNDIISRSALLEQVRHSKQDNPITQPDDVSRALRTLRRGLYDTFIDIIQSAPAVDAEPVRHGLWINKVSMLHGLADYRFDCSVCEHIFWHSAVETFKYCPWCGAKMDGDEDAAD